jgi:hypothetical protein
VCIGVTDEKDQWWLIAGSTDGQFWVRAIQPPKWNAAVKTDDKETVALDIPMTNDDGCCLSFHGSLIACLNVSTSTEKVSTIHYHANGRYVGILHTNSKNVDVYFVQSAQDSLHKKQQ